MRTPSLPVRILLFAAALAAPLTAQQRPMTFLDAQEMRRAGSWAPSPDGTLMLYTVTTPDWQEAASQSDIHIVSLDDGVQSSRRLTYTDDKDESSPTWAPDMSFFVFVSDREDEDQLYMMRHDGGEARRITEAPEGVSGFDFSPDGAWLVYRSGEAGKRQLFRLPTGSLFDAEPVQLTDGDAGVEQWDFSPDGGTIYFTRPDWYDEADDARREAGFTVDIRNMITPLSSLWSVNVAAAEETRLTDDDAYSVDRIEVSADGRWIGFNGGSPERYERNITGAGLYRDLFLFEVTTGEIERLTDNFEVSESGLSFSPDGRFIAFSAPDDMERYSMTEDRIYIREVDDRGGDFRKLGSDFDQSLSVDFWSEDGGTIYFTAGVRATTQFHAVDTRTGEVTQLTDVAAAMSVDRDEDTGTLLIDYTDPDTPPTVFWIDDLDDVDARGEWTQLVEANPQVDDWALGRTTEISWTSTDGKTVGGTLTYPAGYREGQRYPLMVIIHGGPASADLLRFNNRNDQVYAGAGYAVLHPNYRGSRNYGNAHRTDIVGDYFTLGYDDIMTGVDHLIDEGIVDGERMGVFGWSAGGHWSNWILTHTDRFKAISSGAGTMNWISMYAQSDVQRNRQFYIGDDFLYENFEPYWDQSPLKYIANAKTPTMVHVVAGDPRVPSPQSVELHMALKKLGVDTELFMYPGQSHGIPGMRNQYLQDVSEMAWMDYYVRGIGEKFQWRQVLETLEGEEGGPTPIS